MNLPNFFGITPQYLGTIENGNNCLSVEKIILLSEKANISTDYILLGKSCVIDEKMIKNLLDIENIEINSLLNIIKEIIELLKASHQNY